MAGIRFWAYKSLMNTVIRIIGIDPGLRRMGWGIIETLGNSLRFVASGTVTSDDKADLASRLCQLHDGLADVFFTANMGPNKLYLNKGTWKFNPK